MVHLPETPWTAVRLALPTPIRRVGVAVGLAMATGVALHAQAAVDPNVAPRAAALERQGERPLATEMLGRYLATAPDDGRAWLLLGRFYLLDARAWHDRGHTGQPDGALYLDFAGTAFDQAIRLTVDSALVLRNQVAMQRDMLVVEDSGWTAYHAEPRHPDAPPLPDFIVELGRNLLGSCAERGVLLTGDDLESLAVWYAGSVRGDRPDILPIRPQLYATDSLYRRQMAAALKVDSAWAIQRALAKVAADRPVCLTPAADSAALPGVQWTPLRLVRISRPNAAPTGDVISVTSFVQVDHQGGSVWLPLVRTVYVTAARYNPLLCQRLIPLVTDVAPAACR